MLALVVALSQPAHAQELLGHWSFEPGHEEVDSTGMWGPLSLTGTPAISGGRLDVDGAGQNAVSYATASAYVGPTILDKTLVSWVELQNAGVTAGGPLAIDRTNNVDVFDGIVWAENFASQWQSGSNNGIHNMAGGGAPAGMHQVAIAYRSLGSSVEVTTCVDGAQTAQSVFSSPSSWSAGNAEMLMGIRHTLNGARGGLDALIEENRLYGVALTCSEVAGLQPTVCGASDDGEACRVVGDAAQRINTQLGSTVVDEGASKARLRPSTFDGHVTVLKAALEDGGCTPVGESSIERFTYGAYAASALDGGLGAMDNAMTGTLSRGSRSFILTADDGGSFGSTFSTYRRNRFVADVDGASDRVLAGVFTRTQGSNGVWIGVEATCDVHPAAALAAWLGAPLPTW